MRLLGLFLLLVTSLQASEVIVERVYSPGTSIRVIAPIDAMPRGGFFPVRVEMENGTSSAISWDLETEASQYSHYYHSSRARPSITADFRVECLAGEKKVTELLVPIHRQRQLDHHQSMSQSISWSVRSSNSQDQSVGGRYQGDDNATVPKVALSQTLGKDFGSVFSSAWTSTNSGRGSGYGARSGEPADRHRFDSGILFENWRAYVGMDALVFDREDYLKTSPGVRSALGHWVQSGGHLIVLERAQGGTIPEFPELVSYEGFGSRRIIQCGESYDLSDANSLLAILDEVSPLRTVDGKRKKSGGMKSLLTGELGERSLQTNLILIALIIFGVVVGPVNLFKWADKTRRHRLFFTTPLISLVTCVLLIGYMVLRDGFGGDGVRAVAIDVGGPGDSSAAILQEQYSRTGILFSSSFDLDKNASIVSIPAPVTDYNMADSNSAQGQVSYTAELTGEGWEFSGNWFESRSEQAQSLRSVIPSREKLELISSVQGAPRLASSFSYSLEKVFYRESDGKVWKVDTIGPGETVTMSASRSDEQHEAARVLIERFDRENRINLERAIKRSGSFSGQAVGAPKIETHQAIDWKESPVLITGLLK